MLPIETNATNWVEEPDDGFVGHIGPIMRHTNLDLHLYALSVDERHLNLRGMAQGGMIMTLADRAMGSTARADDPVARSATAQLNVNFIDDARAGSLVVAECRGYHRNRSMSFMQSELSQEGRLVATATGIWKMFPPNSASKGRGEVKIADQEKFAEQCGDWCILDSGGFLVHTGPVLKHTVKDNVYAFHPDDRHRNRRGVVQGGMLMTLADCGMGWTVRTGNIAPIIVHLQMNFVAPARIGRIIQLQCSVTVSLRRRPSAADG